MIYRAGAFDEIYLFFELPENESAQIIYSFMKDLLLR